MSHQRTKETLQEMCDRTDPPSDVKLGNSGRAWSVEPISRYLLHVSTDCTRIRYLVPEMHPSQLISQMGQILLLSSRVSDSNKAL